MELRLLKDDCACVSEYDDKRIRMCVNRCEYMCCVLVMMIDTLKCVRVHESVYVHVLRNRARARETERERALGHNLVSLIKSMLFHDSIKLRLVPHHHFLLFRMDVALLVFLR